jgi:hypothetical protein
MVDIFKLFISAANDLPDERELIGHLVTEIPVTLGWQLNLTPMGKNSESKDLILDADYHLIIFGEDIRAPIGYEWHISRSAGRKPPFFIKANIPRTIAGGDFLKRISRYPSLNSYASLAEFRKLVLTNIAQHLIKYADLFDIKSLEFEKVSNFIDELEDVEPNLIDNVTGEDSIILTRERFMPKNGVLLQSPGEEQSTMDSFLE